VTPAAARVTWTTGGETHTADLCLRHAGDIRRLLAERVLAALDAWDEANP
jgi:hypothetical protein